ncbi:MAG: 3-dehydroquinate dehydratase, partial [Veillonellaceae bacterium]|nr:3-dehydroquinate dehydratase [Veillonellaceae bacterium]
MEHILIINGPNLNMLGTREPEIYGSTTLSDINERIQRCADEAGVAVAFFQSNHEGAIVDKIQEAMGRYAYIILNAGAYTHYSVAIRDSIAAIDVPVIEVHMSNIYTR